MKKSLIIFFIFVIIVDVYVSCSKSKNNATTKTFVDTLHETCTQPFQGLGDSATFYLPTAFTPNGDGINDNYNLIGTKLHFSSFSLTIYDTTGKLVHQTTNPFFIWDGTDTTTGVQSVKYKFYVLINYKTTANRLGSAGTYLYLLSTSTSGCINSVLADTSKYEFPDQFNLYTGYSHISSLETFCN